MLFSAKNVVRYLLILVVRLYQVSLGPLLRILNGGHGLCRHRPTCSHYALEALQLHGAWRGGWLTVRRLLRCHPWGTFGDDPVPPKRTAADQSVSAADGATAAQKNSNQE